MKDWNKTLANIERGILRHFRCLYTPEFNLNYHFEMLNFLSDTREMILENKGVNYEK